jgi:prepilin-type processing-associated H-X9-DG protein
MTDVEMRFALVRDAMGRGYSVEEAMREAEKLVAFAITGEPVRNRGEVVSWAPHAGGATVYYADGSHTKLRHAEVGA